MKTKTFIVGMLLVTTTLVRAATNDLTSALQKGLFEEEANHNLDAAAQAYQAVSARFDQDRKLAATAIFRLGEVYRKQGKTNEATAQYERIVREFPDQETLVTLSRQNLAGIGAKGDSPVLPAPTRAARLEQKRLLEEEIKLVEQDLADLRKQLANGVIPQSEVRAKEREMLKLRQQVAALDVDAEDVATGAGAVTPVTDDEEKEIRRIQEIIKNSPDLINAKAADGETPLASAAARGQLRVVQFLLDHGADIQGQSSALNLAAFNGHKAVVELLLDRRADVNARDSSGKTPLHAAAENGFQSVAETLLAHKADVNAQTKKQETPLSLAAAKGHSAMVDLLIAKGAQLDAKDAKGWTALTMAAVQGHALVVKHLLDARADPNIPDGSGRTALSYAVQRGSTDVVKLLLEGKADPHAGSADSPLLLAVRADSAALAELLLRADADPNQPTDCATVSMAQSGFGGLEGGAKQRQTDPLRRRSKRTPLQAAVLEDYPAMAKLLLQFKGDAKAKNESNQPLVLDALNNAEILKAFLDGGADANARYENGPCALVLAAGNLNSAAVELLLDHGADANVREDQRGTPLHISAEKNDKKSVELLLNAKADVNAATTSGLLTALHLAVNQGSGEITEMLLAHGANPNLKDNTGNTPLHWAMGIGTRGIGAQKMVELLLSKGADPNLRNNNGQTPLDLAKGVNSSPAPGFGGFVPPPPQGIPTRTVRQPGVSANPANTGPIDITALLREHGARDDLPKLDRIEVRRPSDNYSATVFGKGTEDYWNQFTMLELIAVEYGLLTTYREAHRVGYSGESLNRWQIENERKRVNPLPFPDLSRIIIRRPTADGKAREAMTIDVASFLQSGDCAKDTELKWGDVVEIAETDHPIAEQWPGFSEQALHTFMKCLTRKVAISVKDQTVLVSLSPSIGWEEGKLKSVVSNRQFGLLPVLQESKLLRASSDLARVKLSRRDPATGQARAWVIDCTGNNPANPWLRDGDVVDVPDKR